MVATSLTTTPRSGTDREEHGAVALSQPPLTSQAEAFLEHFLDGLAVSDTRYEQAETSYTSFGKWLHRPDSTVKHLRPDVYVQGSFALGTTIRPTTENEDYDVDIVTEFHALRVGSQTQLELKTLMGGEVRSYHAAQSMTKPVREGRRCWVLDYADGAQFHMDIVPSVPNGERLRVLLEQANLNAGLAASSIGITDNERWNYTIRDEDWARSNPRGYVQWFRGRMTVEFERRRRILAEQTRASVEAIPEYRVRTPLQAAVMILKRHRDMRYRGAACDKPISIIITTLAAHAYQQETTISGALMSILNRMDSFIQVIGGKYVISNPSDPLENFADKWAEFPERARAFFAWLKQARDDFAYLGSLTDHQRLVEAATAAVGSRVAKVAGDSSGASRGLRAASVAPVAGVGFGNTPRVPNNPKEFG